MQRRAFLLLVQASAARLWIPERSAIVVPRTLILHIGGACSFCDLPAVDTAGVAGVLSVPSRICRGCIGLCVDVLDTDGLLGAEMAEYGWDSEKAKPPAPEVVVIPGVALRSARGEDFRRVLEEQLMAEGYRLDDMLEGRIRIRVDGSTSGRVAAAPALPESVSLDDLCAGPGPKTAEDATGALLCSFCQKRQADVAKLIAGRAGFICDACVTTAAVLFSKSDQVGALSTV